MNRIIRVFPRRTGMTPTDSMAFVGDPPLWRPQADEVHVSVTFTWDIEEGHRLQNAWADYYPIVRLGGPALANSCGNFEPGMYIRQGVTFTSRGCNNACPWCLVPDREGALKLLPIRPGHVIQDNNFLQCPRNHRLEVYKMLDEQPQGATFSGGLDARLVDDEIAIELANLRVKQIFLAADTDESLPIVAVALNRLHFLGRDKLRVYVLCGFGGESPDQAERRLEQVWQAGGLPFAQLYQPADKWIDYPYEWRALARTWSRPAATKARISGNEREACERWKEKE